MKHLMNLKASPYKLIQDGSKTIEMRLFDEKRQKLCVGDFIEFNNNENDETILTEITNLYRFKSFDELYSHFDKISIGYKENDIPNPKDMSKYYDESEIEKLGVVAIEIKKI